MNVDYLSTSFKMLELFQLIMCLHKKYILIVKKTIMNSVKYTSVAGSTPSLCIINLLYNVFSRKFKKKKKKKKKENQNEKEEAELCFLLITY